jgi:hypothetical protein
MVEELRSQPPMLPQGKLPMPCSFSLVSPGDLPFPSLVAESSVSLMALVSCLALLVSPGGPPFPSLEEERFSSSVVLALCLTLLVSGLRSD